jgi:uncharacterized lipoprotein YmbA
MKAIILSAILLSACATTKQDDIKIYQKIAVDSLTALKKQTEKLEACELRQSTFKNEKQKEGLLTFPKETKKASK